MIEVKELRIGNLVLPNDAKHFVDTYNNVPQVVDIDLMMEIDGVHARRYEAIPLTEEWLIKFGLKEIPSMYAEFCDKTFELSTTNKSGDKRELYFNISEGKIDNNVDGEIRFVHEFQNYIFSRTGKELAITKP